MTLQSEIRDDLEAEVFGAFGKTVTFINKTTPIYNTWGELEDWTETSTSIVVVPYDITWDRKATQKFGSLKEGEMSVAVKYDQTIAKNDVFVIEEERFSVVDIMKNYLPDNVVTIVKLAREEYVTSDNVASSA